MKPLKYQEVVRLEWRGYHTHLWDRPRRYGSKQNIKSVSYNLFKGKKGKLHTRTGTEALYRPYGP